MKRRFKRWISHMFVRYLPGTSKIASVEAKRLSEHIFDSFDENQQYVILNHIKSNLIEMRENQIKNKELDIIKTRDDKNRLENNLERLKLL